MKRLTLLRHAKSSWKDPSLADFHRPLNKRGRRDAPLMGERLAARDVDPDRILTSPARRARKTARIVAEHLGVPRSSVEEEDAIYEADTGTLLGLIRGLDPHDHVLLVGHNPGFTDLGNLLADAGIDNIPTCGVLDIVFAAARSWSEVEPGTGSVAFFDAPKKPVDSGDPPSVTPPDNRNPGQPGPGSG